jgi:hypothetical protein
VTFQNAVDQAVAELEIAYATVQIQRQLAEKAKADFESAQAALVTATAEAERARLESVEAGRDFERKKSPSYIGRCISSRIPKGANSP